MYSRTDPIDRECQTAAAVRAQCSARQLVYRFTLDRMTGHYFAPDEEATVASRLSLSSAPPRFERLSRTAAGRAGLALGDSLVSRSMRPPFQRSTECSSSGVMRLSIVNDRFGRSGVRVVPATSVVSPPLLEMGDSGPATPGRGECGSSVGEWSMLAGCRMAGSGSIVVAAVGQYASAEFWARNIRLMLASAASSSFRMSLSVLCSLKRFRRRSRLPFSNISNAWGWRAQ
uniref:Uncharacterized protein n=1 Tax=Anopheles melas TaxID=34690 RepID=A0A182TKL5_9DIPT